MAAHAPVLTARNIVKDFPGVRALDRVSFDVYGGEIHALVGENGAGKSTLIKVLAGVRPAGTYEGTVAVGAERCRFRSTRDSEQAGIAVIHQELALVPHLTAGENIFLGDEPTRLGHINWERLYREARNVLERLGLEIDGRETVRNLSVGSQQLVEIAKAIHKRRCVLILDEPTSALSRGEFATLAGLLDDLRKRGTAVIYISHKLDEVLQLADRITVLRDGQTIASRTRKQWTRQDIVLAMVGRELTEMYPRASRNPGRPLLEVEDLSVADPNLPDRRLVDRVSFLVCAGEVLGIAGLIGAGRTELLMTLFGHGSGTQSGRVRVDGTEVRIRSPEDAIRAGLALVPEDRNQMGLIPQFPVVHNLSLAHLASFTRRGFLDDRREFQRCDEMAHALRIKMTGLDAPVHTLSGGNQQKVVLGKWMLELPKILFLDEPTRGIDVGAKVEIYRLINELTCRGLAVVVVSSELPEVLGISDRILVLREGQLTGEFSHDEATPQRIMEVATT